MTVAPSEEDDKQRARQDIVRSFLYGERAYVTLLSSLVQVTLLQSLLITVVMLLITVLALMQPV